MGVVEKGFEDVGVRMGVVKPVDGRRRAVRDVVDGRLRRRREERRVGGGDILAVVYWIN